MDKIESLRLSFRKQLKPLASLEEVENLSLRYLGRNGEINRLLQIIKRLSPFEKKTFGEKINQFKSEIQRLIELKRQVVLKRAEGKEYVDVTLPGKSYPKGSLHLVTYAIEEISDIFKKIGFIRMTYPEVEWEYFSFDALNMPKGHPARDDFETFFVDAPENAKMGKMVLTPHTSSGQIREMLRIGQPPIRMINIAKCYRPNWDVSHTPMFHQFEGMVVDHGINITNLKGTIEYFAKQFFGDDREIRLRPFHFQFTEPSFEIDVTCGICLGTGIINGKKCKLCKAGWLELGGSGMIHPNVLKAGKIDPQQYSGWAFGFGVERVIMMKESMSIEDMRILYSSDIRFLNQF